VDVYAPKPTVDAWHIKGAVNNKGAFALGSEVKILYCQYKKQRLFCH
jgi:hypothetical protein